ncbi:unnamed protein product [Moneuplotes crassus]|uniref:Uncharacterized protein n=1 Tax=Euplotes crassus TaxID=5936 RepID=A0AAD1Y2A5_EUPCR|nr:unnamed protein product [Moneuplotes crassus]
MSTQCSSVKNAKPPINRVKINNRLHEAKNQSKTLESTKSLSGISEVPSVQVSKVLKKTNKRQFILDCTNVKKSRIPEYYDFRAELIKKNEKRLRKLKKFHKIKILKPGKIRKQGKLVSGFQAQKRRTKSSNEDSLAMTHNASKIIEDHMKTQKGEQNDSSRTLIYYPNLNLKMEEKTNRCMSAAKRFPKLSYNQKDPIKASLSERIGNSCENNKRMTHEQLMEVLKMGKNRCNKIRTPGLYNRDPSAPGGSSLSHHKSECDKDKNELEKDDKQDQEKFNRVKSAHCKTSNSPLDLKNQQRNKGLSGIPETSKQLPPLLNLPLSRKTFSLCCEPPGSRLSVLQNLKAFVLKQKTIKSSKNEEYCDNDIS